jgi:hypothetical protein
MQATRVCRSRGGTSAAPECVPRGCGTSVPHAVSCVQTDTTKELRCGRYPAVLVVQLVRFKFDRNGMSYKLKQHVAVPERLAFPANESDARGHDVSGDMVARTAVALSGVDGFVAACRVCPSGPSRTN